MMPGDMNGQCRSYQTGEKEMSICLGVQNRLTMAALVIVVTPAVVTAQSSSDSDRHQFLQSVARVGETVFASNRSGLFRANVEDQTWRCLDLPEEVTPGGYFGVVKDDSKAIVYRSCSNFSYLRDEVNTASGAIFRSKDLGETWTKLIDCNGVGPTLLHAHGTLYAANVIVDDKFTLLATSDDGGVTWRDIRNGIWGSVSAFSEDPEHDGLICVYTYGPIRGYVWQAKDRGYEWKEFREIDWIIRTKEHRDPFRRSYSTRNVAYMLPATLNNYFDYEFGERVQIPGLTIVPEKTDYDFVAGEPMAILVEIRFREDVNAWRPGRRNPMQPRKPSKVAIIDEPTGQLWNIRARRNGELFTVGGTLQQEALDARSPSGIGHWVAKKRKELLLTQHVVDAETPMRRTYDLSEYEEFNAAGTYEVQFSYNSGPIADRDFEWSGYFNSPVVTVDVSDPK